MEIVRCLSKREHSRFIIIGRRAYSYRWRDIPLAAKLKWWFQIWLENIAICIVIPRAEAHLSSIFILPIWSSSDNEIDQTYIITENESEMNYILLYPQIR